MILDVELYHMSQIHGTIVGIEKLIGLDDLFNATSKFTRTSILSAI